MIPLRLINPTVGLIPTIPDAFEGQTIEPFVSVPIAKTVRLIETATPEPELEPRVAGKDIGVFRLPI